MNNPKIAIEYRNLVWTPLASEVWRSCCPVSVETLFNVESSALAIGSSPVTRAIKNIWQCRWSPTWGRTAQKKKIHIILETCGPHNLASTETTSKISSYIKKVRGYFKICILKWKYLCISNKQNILETCHRMPLCQAMVDMDYDMEKERTILLNFLQTYELFVRHGQCCRNRAITHGRITRHQ